MSDFEYWKLSDRLNIVQAALLISGHDPAEYEDTVEKWELHHQPSGYHACKTALIRAIEQERLDGAISRVLDANWVEKVDLRGSLLCVESLRAWLLSKGICSGFFFPEESITRDYLDPEHQRYAPKLAAAVKAWEAAGGDPSLRGTPKQRVEKWIRLHASEYGLTQSNGKPNESAIKAIARIANWNPEGGAPATSSKDSVAAGTEDARHGKVVKFKAVKSQNSAQSPELDDDIPF